MRIRSAKSYYILAPPCRGSGSGTGGGGWGWFSANSTEAAPNLNCVARYFSFQTPNPSATPFQTSVTYDKLINTAGRQRDFDTVKQLLAERMRVGLFNTGKTFKFISTDVSVLPQLLQNLAAMDDWFARKQAHDALLAQLASIGRIPDALRLAEKMVKHKYGATPLTFRPLFTLLAQKGDIAAAWRVTEFMQVCNLKPDLMSFNHILTAYCCRGDLTSAADVLVKMEEQGLNADRMTYDALVIGACMARKLEVAIEVIRRMLDQDEMSPLVSTHAHIIKEMVKCGYVAQAMEYVKIFGGRDESLDAKNFGFLAKLLVNTKRITEAISLLDEMQQRNIQIRDEWKSVIGKLSQSTE